MEEASARFYVIKNLSNGLSCGMKIISNNIEESQFEAKIQIDLSNKVNKEESRLMSLFDVIEEKDDNGKVVKLYLVMPLASFGNVKELRNKLKEEKDDDSCDKVGCSNSILWRFSSLLPFFLRYSETSSPVINSHKIIPVE